MVRYLANFNRDEETAQTAIATYIKGGNFALEAANFYIAFVFNCTNSIVIIRKAILCDFDNTYCCIFLQFYQIVCKRA
jgi:hypothetical protein